jgi:uncharacterized protein (DUF1786 family)
MMTDHAAYTVRNDLNQVRDLGITITTDDNEPRNFKGESLTIEEVNLGTLQEVLSAFDATLSDVDVVAIAVQDHGVFPEGTSNRRFRIQQTKELLKENPRPENLAFTETEIPSYFLRMKSAAQASKRQLPRAEVLLMDTSLAAILGCLQDPVVEKANPILAVNVGNGHTLAALISEGQIVGVLEHHTRLLDPPKSEQLLRTFGDGQLSDDEVFNDNGHGLFYLEDPPGFSKIETIAATGPNRNILAKTNLAVHFAAPAGDVMMTGPFGLVAATKKQFRGRPA